MGDASKDALQNPFAFCEGLPAMTLQQASSLIRGLEMFAARPHLYLGKADAFLAAVHLGGFQFALLLSANASVGELRRKIIVERGWDEPKASGSGLIDAMTARGMTQEQMIDELVAIEIEIIKRSAA